MTLDDYEVSNRAKVLIYGPPKSGKTAAVGQLARDGYQLYWLDLEKGISTLRNPAILPPEFRKNIHPINIPDHRGYPVAIQTVKKVLRGGVQKICAAHGVSPCPICAKVPTAVYADSFDILKFTERDVLVIDSLTQLTASAANAVTLKAWQKDEEYRMDFDDFRMQGMKLDEILSLIQALPINVVVISHETDVSKESAPEKLVPLGGTKNFSKTVAKYFDEIVYTQIFNKSHRAFSGTTWSPNHLTGGRSGVTLEASKGDLRDVFAALTGLEKVS
jgi:hypothetical protein